MPVASGAPPPVHAQDLLVWNSDSSSSSSSESEPDLVKELIIPDDESDDEGQPQCKMFKSSRVYPPKK